MKPVEHSQSMTLPRSGPAVDGNSACNSPFDPDNRGGYEKWRSQKLKKFPVNSDDLMVNISNPASPSRDEKNALLERCLDFNMAIYATQPEAGKVDALALAHHAGLERFDHPLYTGDDGFAEITKVEDGRRRTYIPYSDKPLSWHTDGYYNKPDQQVRGLLLHCRRAAVEGGGSEFLDPDIVYIRLRDENPDFIRALMRVDVLTIPANLENGVQVREAETGPVFSVIGGTLHMRYTDRKRHIQWQDDALVLAARRKLTDVLNDADEYIVRCRLRPGQGIICNNVLHRRSGYKDHPDAGQGRLLYRARFLDRVAAPL